MPILTVYEKRDQKFRRQSWLSTGNPKYPTTIKIKDIKESKYKHSKIIFDEYLKH